MLDQYARLPRPVYVLCVGTFINRAGAMMVPFLTLYLQQKLGLGEQFATFAMGCFGLGAIVALLAGGHLADTIGRRTMMIASLTGGAVILLFFGRLTHPYAILSAVIGFALIAEMYRPAASAMIADLVPPLQRPAAFGLMYVAINLGFTVGPALGGILAKRYSFNVLFLADAATALIYAVILAMATRETLAARAVGAARGDVPPNGRKEAAAPQVGVFDAFGRIRSDHLFLMFAAATLFVGMTYSQALSTLPLHMRRLGIAADDYGLLIAINGLMIVLLQLPITAWTGRFHRVHMVAAAAAITAVGFGLIGLAVARWQIALCIMIWTIGEMMQSPYVSSIVADLAPADLRARYMGVFSMCYSSGNMLGAPIGGVILAHLGGGALWSGCAGIGLLAAGMYFRLRHRISPHPAVVKASGAGS